MKTNCSTLNELGYESATQDTIQGYSNLLFRRYHNFSLFNKIWGIIGQLKNFVPNESPNNIN